MPYNPIYDGQFDYPEKIYNLLYSPYINSDIDMPTPLFSPDKKLTSGVGFGESSYDTEESAMSVTNPSFINRQRASNQSEWVKGFNSIVGGVASGLATAVQDVSYLLDIDNGIKRLTGAEEVEENAIGQLMRDFKQGLATTMPIYKEDPNKVWSWSDSGSYWEALKGVIDSAVGFGLPGLGAAKLVGSAVKAARVNALLQAYLTENKVNAITSLGAGFMTNYAEGKTMAIEAYENSMQNLKSNYYDGILKKYIDQGLDPNQALELANKEYEEGLKSGKEKEFSKIAGSEADKFQRNNMVFMLTDALGIHGVLKGTKGFTRSMVDKNELKNYFLGLNADNFLVQGVKEGAEEIGQNIMQSEAEYQAAKKGGIETGEPSDFTQRMIKFGTDDKALLEGAMGFFGGPSQRVLMSTLSGKYSSSYKKSIQDQIDKQDTQLKENEATLNSILNTQAKASDLKAEALMNGDTKSAELIDKTSFALLAANNFVNGTTERLERSLYDILDMDEEQANKEGYTPDYKEKAQSMLEDLKVSEKEWIGISGYSTASPLFMKMQDAKYLRSIRENLMQEKDKESTNLKNYLLKNHGEEANKGKIPVATFKPTGTLTFDEINEIATTGNTSSEREDMLDFEYIKSLPEYQNFSKALNRLNTADEALGKTIDDIKYYKSNEGIREYKESIKNAKKLIEEVEKAKKISKKKESERSKRKEDASKTKKESEGKPNESANPVITPETTDVVPGDFDDLMDNPPITEGINPTEDLIGNSVSPELNKELQKEATASNEELEKSFKDNQELKKELQEGVVTEKIDSEELNDSDIEAKKADIERRRQEELNSNRSSTSNDSYKNSEGYKAGKDEFVLKRLRSKFGSKTIYDIESTVAFAKRAVDYLNNQIQEELAKKSPSNELIEGYRQELDYYQKEYLDYIKTAEDSYDKKYMPASSESEDKINAKYDAELAALEQSHTTPSEVASKLEEDEAKINDTGYNSNTYQEVIDESNSVESTIEDSSRAIVKPDGSIVYDYDRINQGNNVVAFLSRAYEDIVTFVKNIVSISRQDLDNKFNESSKNALRYKNNKPGTKLKFVVEDNPDAVVYIKDSQETTTWGAVSAGLDKSSDEFIMQVPIAIYNEAGDKIGYVHTKDWITEKHVSGDLNTDMEALSKTRKAILSGKVNGIITGNNAGMFFRTRGNQLVAVSKAMPDPKLELVVSKNGLPYTNRNTTSNKTPINKLKDGLLYAIVPYRDKHVALPLMVGNINENHARALIKAITIYATNDTKNPFREYVLKTLKLDITTPAGINEFLKIYVNDTSLNGNIVPGNTNVFRFHVSKGKIYFARGGTDITKAPYIAQSGDTNSMAFRELMNLISNNIRTLYYNVSLDKLDSGNIISLDADGNASESNYRDHIKGNSYSNILGFNVGTESDPEYTYTLQPSITFSIDSKEDTTKPSKEENKVVTKPVNVSTTDKEKPVKKALPSKLIKKINTDDDITSDALLSSNTKKALENNSKNVYSPKLGAKIQNGVVNYIIGRVIDKAFSSMDLADRAESKKLDITGELESIKNEYIKERDEALANVEELTKLLGDEEYNQEDIVSAIESNKYYAAMANTVIEEWKVMTRLAQEGIFKLNNAKFDTLIEESIDTELEDNGESPERAFDSSQLTFDTLNKLSVKVKRLFGGIKKVKNNGEPLLNAFNQEMSMPFDEVYNTLQSLTTNLKPSYEVMKAKMLASKEKFPWITQVIDKLDAADELTRNSFVTGMSNHSRDMKFYMWARDKNGKFTLAEYDANANSVTQILLNTWANNIMYNINSEISKQMVIGDSVVIAGNPEVIDLVQAQFEKFRTNPSKVTTEELSQWLKSIGIELSTKSIEYIRNNMVASKNWNANFSSRSGIFNIINSNLGKLKNDNIDGSDFLKDSALKELARIEATFSKDVLPTSFRAGKKSVFSYGNNNLLVDSIRRLKEYNTLEDGTFTSDVLTELMSTSFTRESYWLKSMLVYDAEGKPLKGTDGKYRIDPTSSGYANLNHAVMSLEAIKEIKTKSRDNRELHKLSPAEVELVKISMLQSVTSDLSGKNQRRIKVTFPTTSDKTTVMMLSTIAFDIKYNTDGTIDDNTLNRLYDIFVLPELYRITNYQANGKKLNVDAYNDGADKFLLFPEFNNIDGLFDEDGNISLEAYNDAFKSKFKDLINKYIEELVADKLSNWNTYGIGLSSKPGDEKPYTNAFLDAKFMDNITTKGVAKENAVKAAATDMVVQYLVSNVEAMKMFIGDPAQFWKAKPTDDIITATRKLYDNVGKRLAGDIAPGTTLAESEGNTYIQLFAEDVETPSKELDDRLFMYLSPEDIKAYKKMNSADAQEYTTWKEHLDVLFMLGKITQQDKDTITSIINRYVDKKSKNLPIEKEDRLTKDQIHMVLQPMKPVYVNTSVYEGDYDFRRRVYIKSSSFPLIPELTDGLEIDNLRVAMEELETSTNKGVRLAYASAAKIGAVSSKATIFKNGRFVKGLKFTEDNYLVLDRKGFRIQQEIPYDPNKQEIREVTQASKNLFLDVLDVDGFKLPNDNTEYSGKQLYNKFVEAHSKLYTTSKMLLLNRILNKDGKTINIPELRELLKEEALKRNYNISDRLLIDLDKDLEFLPYSAIESKYQAVLNAIVYNNIVKQKIHGKSFVLGSQVGFKQTEVISSAKGISGIIFTEEFDSEIKPMHIVNGELKPNQVILPWKFRDNYGNILDINNFTKVVNDRVVIDTTKLPKELLLGFGMRIPNQAQNSQAVFEIVGFLPESMQDLIIAPEEFTIQMGSDFDVDKLYTYTYNTWYNNKTKELSKISLSDSEIRELYYKRRDKDENVDRLLEALFGENATKAINYDYELFAAAIKMLEYQNELVDIHIASHMNPHPKVQEAISKPLDNWIIEDVAAEVNKARISRESNRMFAPMSESYQTKKFMQATAGKAGCLGYGTKVLMYDGKLKEVQDVVEGDLLMGIDSTPRKVLQLCRGIEQMYWVRQNKGIDYRVNESHILSLKHRVPTLYSQPTINGKRVKDFTKILKNGYVETVNIQLNNYLKSNKDFKKNTYGYKCSGIDFSKKELPISPYYLGLWLGDGSTRDIKTIHNIDNEIIDYLKTTYGIAYQDGCDNISIHIADKSINKAFKSIYNVNKVGLNSGSKHIPDVYLYNSRENRLQLLAGLIDSDGYYCKLNKQYRFSNVNKVLIDQVAYLTRSLGFYTSISSKEAQISKRGLNEQKIWYVTFIPECDIPVKIKRKTYKGKSNFKNRLHTGITIEKDTVDNYYGFVLDGDHLFMLEDLTITHNTGIFSLDSMFNALAQTVNTLEFNSTDNKGNEILKPIAFGNVVSDFKLNRINTLDNKYTISKVISGYQSASVDNEKLQVLDKLNINSETFEVIKLLNQLGFGEEVLWFISQDIIFDYVNEVIRLKGTLGEFVKDAKILAFMNTLINKYGYTQEGIQLLVEFGEGSTLYNPSLDDMKSLVKYSKDSVPSNFKEAQAHILLKFMNLQSLAKDLSTLERGINLDSKGFGASLFDSVEKEESIIKSISSNNIKGASSLFGDVVINPKAEAISELESNGYVLLEYNNSNLNIYIKPTTIPGLALVHGLDVNNSLWREISPIVSQRFQTISKRMAVLTTADTRSNKAEFNKEVWDGVRSFIFANSNWNDSLNNTSERREILLTDKEAEVISNINGVDTKVKIKTSKSLGTILNEIKNTPLFRSNAFLRRLEVIPQTTNGTTIYTIQYRAGIKEGVNDTEIYTDFLGLLLNEVKITDNNNKEYTTTDLAQDLIEYSFITGGIQGATEFIKLIPPAYLHSIGMFKYVNDFFYEDSTLLPLTDLYAFNRFELEFIRNNPGLVKPKVNTSDEEFKSFKPVYDSSKRLQAFTIPFVDNNGNSNTGLIARYATLNEGNVVPVPFITIRNYNSPSGYDLYYFDGQSQYLYISTLGNKNISEYNSVGAGLFNSTYKPVIIPDVDKPITNIAAPTINSKSIFDSTTISIAYDNLLKHLDGNELQGKEGVKALLDLLAYSSSTDAVDSSIISIMSNNLHKLPDNIKIVFNLDEASDKEGMFVYDLNNNNINTLFFKDTLLGQLATKDGIDYALPIILHELYHAFTSRLITKFSKGEKIEDDNLRKILVSLESSRRQYKEHLSNKYPEEFEEFNIKYSKFTGGDKTITFSDREIAIFYPSVSLKEFTAQTTSAEDFMNELNMIYSDNSTLLSKVFDSLSKLLSYIFGIDNNTLFYKSLTESLELINPNLSNSNNFQERYDIEFQEETSGTSLSEMYRNRTIKNASADATIALAVDFTTAGEKLTKSSVNNQNKKYIPIDANNLEVTQERVNKIVSELNSVNAKTLNIAGNGIYTMKQYTQKQIDDFTYELLKAVVDRYNLPKVEEFNGFWTRKEVAEQTDKVFLFGDNTNDRLNTKYVPSSTQAVIRGLPNSIGIDTKKDRGTNDSSYFTDADFVQFKQQVDEAIQKAKDSGKTIVLPADGIGTGKAMLKEKAPKLFEYLQNQLSSLKSSVKLNNKIESIRTGGQTGFDEAGAKAGERLGIKTLVLAPKGFTFRNANNEDISDEQQFKDRFKINSQPVNTSNLQISEKENNKIPKATGLMKFSYGNNKRADVTSLTTLEAIKKGERTATTRYESDGNINYWKNLKVGDIIEWEGQNSEKVLVEVTKPLHKLRGSGKTAEQWSKLEGWSVDYFNSKVKPRLDEAWQIEFKPISDQTINTSNSNYKWARYSNNSYEVSSQGDKRFSALFAKLQPGADITIIRGFPDGTYSLETVKLKAPLTIEEIYQIYIKGYKTVSEGKGKPPKYDISKEERYNLYKNLWRVYLEQNPELEQDLREKAKGKVLTDKFASTDISQARALAEILNEKSTVNTSTLQKRNVFTINPTKAIDKKASVKASVANKFIGYGEGIEGSSTENYRKQAGEYANTGNYNSNDVVFVSIGGKRPANNLELRKSQQDRTIKEAIKAIEAGATLITDNVNYIHYNSKTKQQRPITMSVEEFRKEDGLYNEGEKRLYENLKVKGYNYSEQTVDGEVLGVWTNNSTTNAVVEEKLSKPSVIESYTEFGTTYKFELVDGEIVKATYTQGYSSNELELSPKNWYKVYNRLKDTPKQEEVKPTSPTKKSNTTFTFSDGITVDTDFELNSEQAIALQKMADFFNKPNSTGLKDNAFILSGYAGTGKTSIIKYLVKYIREANRRKGKYQTIVFSSPTHRANMQLKKNTKETVNTMHSLFGLSPDLEIENLDYNDLKFITISDPKLGPEDILIVDESSMISAAMLKIMEDLVESFDSTSTKVIFMGDKAQLGPVKDHKQSPVFDLVNKADLTKVERTKDSPLLDEITHIRNAKQDEKPYTYSSTQNANGNGVTFVTKRNQFLESIAKAFLSTEFKNDKLAYRALAFTNEEVKEINTSVRNAMFGNDAVNQYQKGELVMAYANRFKSMRTKEFMYMNGTDYIVTQSSNGVKEYNGIQYNGINVTLQSEYNPDITVSTFVIITENNSITNLKALSSYLESLRLAAVRASGSSKGVLWKEYYNNFNSFVANSNVTEINPVTGKLKVLIPKGIDYGYAHTIHKSQGGEYKQVFINDADISRSPDENMKSQLRYVAASRAKEHATIFYSNTISKEKITNFEEDSTTPDYRDFSMPLSDIPDIPDHILDNPDYDPNKIMNDYNSRIDNIDFDNDINTFNDINPSPEDSYHSDLLLKGYITRDDIERLKKICK